MKTWVLISVWSKSGDYVASYDDSKDPPITTATIGDIEVDNQVIFEAIEHIKKAVKED